MDHSAKRRDVNRGFTLVELLITVAIIGIMASMMAFAMFSAQETAKVAKTKALIAKLDSIIKNRWDGYRTRRVPIGIPPDEPYTDLNNNGHWDVGEPFTDQNGNGVWDYSYLTRAQIRLRALRDLMRMELPDRWTDVISGGNAVIPVSLYAGVQAAPPSSVWLGYARKALAKTPTTNQQGAECLYMIVMAAMAEEGDAREIFRASDVADTDGDGFPEFIDAWGKPIHFLRWAPGFQLSEQQVIDRAFPTKVQGSGTITLSAAGLTFNSSATAYTGGVLISSPAPASGQARPYPLDPLNAVRITGYQYSVGGNSATFSYPPAASPTFPSDIAIMAPDPFDTNGVLANSTAAANNVADTPSFAIYPLIFSEGPDKAEGIVTDIGVSAGNIRPFIYSTNGSPPELLGTARQLPGEPSNSWVDNIHNHLIGLR